jgi:hypothetical protein
MTSSGWTPCLLISLAALLWSCSEPAQEDVEPRPEAAVACVDEEGNSYSMGPDCCGEFGRGDHTGMAECVDGLWSCEMYEEARLCLCKDDPMSFFCSDFCSSDIIDRAMCADGEWTCRGIASVRSTDCPADTCWGCEY